MKRKLLSLIALLAFGGTIAAWGYAQDGGPAEPARFQPPAAGSLSGQLESAKAAVAPEQGSASGGEIQQTAGLEWLLQRKPSNQGNSNQTTATPKPASQQATQPRAVATTPNRGPAPVTIDRSAAQAYRPTATPASTGNATTTTQFKPVQSRLLGPANGTPAPAEPRVASRPLGGADPAPQPAQLAAPQPVAKQPSAISAPSFSDRSIAATSTGTIITAAAPQLGLTVTGPEAIVVGRETQYNVQLTNDGQTPANDIVVQLAVPAHVTMLGTDAKSGIARTSQQSGGTIDWSVNSLGTGETAQLTLTLAATQPRAVNFDIRYAAAPTVANASIEVQQPKLEVTLNGPSEINYGETRQYTLAISNPGTGDAENVVLQLQPLSRNLEAGVTKQLGTLKAGDRKAIEIELSAEEAGQLAVRASVSAAGGLDAQTQLTVHVRRAELAVEVIGPAQKFAGSEAIYQVKLSNKGDAIATGVALAALLPESAEVLDATEGFSSEEGNLGWKIGSLAPGDARIYRVVCSLGKAGQNLIELRAKSDTNLTAAGAVRTNVEAIADLKLLVNDPKGPIAVGKDASYEIRIINRGSKAAENVTVKGYFSEGIEPQTVDGALGKIDVGQALFDPIARIEAGEELVLKITARASAGGNHIFRAVVECELPETRLVTEETTRYFETTANGFGDTLQR